MNRLRRQRSSSQDLPFGLRENYANDIKLLFEKVAELDIKVNNLNRGVIMNDFPRRPEDLPRTPAGSVISKFKQKISKKTKKRERMREKLERERSTKIHRTRQAVERERLERERSNKIHHTRQAVQRMARPGGTTASGRNSALVARLRSASKKKKPLKKTKKKN